MTTKMNPMRFLMRFLLAVAGLMFLAGRVEAQVPNRPKAGPEHKVLEAQTGEWTYDGTLRDTPLGPGGRFSGKSTVRMVLDGLFMEVKGEDTGVYGGKEMSYKSTKMTWYDATTTSYAALHFDNDGVVRRSTDTVKGDTWTSLGTATDSTGKTYMSRCTTTFAADGTSFRQRAELSLDDGKTWKPHWDAVGRKTGSGE